MQRMYRLLPLALLPFLAACSSGSGNQEQVQTGQIEIDYTLACQGNVAEPSIAFSATGQGYQQQQNTLSNANLTGSVTFLNVPVDTAIAVNSTTSVTCANGDIYGYTLVPTTVTVNQLSETVKVQASPVLQSARLTVTDGGV